MTRSLSLALANINARISNLAENKSAALERAHAAAGTAAGEHSVAEELLRCVIPEGQSLEGHQYRTHRRLQSAVELLIVGINGQRGPRRNRESADWNHHESSTGIFDFQFPHESDVLAHAGKHSQGKGPIEMRGAVNNKGLAMLLKHLLFQN